MVTKKVELGKKVPSFKAESLQGRLKLSDFKGKKLVLFFYPKDLTPGCTTESIDFSHLLNDFKKLSTEVVGVSRDSLGSHQKFCEKHDLTMNLISDEEESLCHLFDVIKMKSLYGRKFRGIERSTFLISEKGILLEEWRGVKVPGHAEKVLNYIKGESK